MHDPNSQTTCGQETYVLQALADVRKLIYYKLGSSHQHAGEDLAQRVFCKLWTWRSKRDVVLAGSEWHNLAKRVVTTEIAEYFSEKYTKDIVFSQGETDLRESVYSKPSSSEYIEGNTNAETHSLLAAIWKKCGILSLRQRYAFVLQTGDFLIEFIAAGICRRSCLAEYFELTEDEITELLGFFPLSDDQIIQLIAAKTGTEITTQQLWEARAKAKAKLAAALDSTVRHAPQKDDRRMSNSKSTRSTRRTKTARSRAD
jgi:DNA-directed RNA polymerase specialized sigma24 family protein